MFKLKEKQNLTIAISIVSCDFLSYGNGSDYPESDVLSFTKKLAIVVAVMLF